MRHTFIGLLFLALVVAACGGGDSGDADPTTSTSSAKSGTDSGTGADSTTTRPTAGEEPDPSAQEGTGVATLGDRTLQFQSTGGPIEICDLDVNDAGVIVNVVMSGLDEDGEEISLTISGPISGGDGLVTVGDPFLVNDRWIADATVYDRLASIQGMPDGVGATVQLNGNTVSGTGIFYEDKALNEVRPTGDPYESGVLEGTFQATCPHA